MDNRPHLKNELKKPEKVKQYLRTNGISYLEDLISF
jgi:hypothetical protein